MVVKPHPLPFANRTAAGAALAAHLERYAGRPGVIVLGLPRGGVPVAVQVARALGAPLDVFVVRKLGVPGHRELAMGAIASGGVIVLDENLISSLRISVKAIRAVVADEQRELARRERLYREGRPPLVVQKQIVVLVDDGLATGSTMGAAVQAVRKLEPAAVVVAAPVGSHSACHKLEQVADDVICASIPPSFAAVGNWYVDFSETSDEEVRALLQPPAPPSAEVA